ncbi:MAG: YdbH domain-containing protein [Sphingomonas sp.]|nr:YdbH domain-containing protein [Sphingomonas sp.]
MTESTGEARRKGRRARWIGGSLAVLGLAAVGLWIERRPIVTHYVDRELARRGVSAAYTIADVGLRTQRLTNVVLGDPAQPDLVADWVELTTNVSLSGAEVSAVRAGQVRLRGRLVDGKLKLGAVDKLLPAANGKPFALPTIWVDVADARLRLETPEGVIGAKLAGRGRLSDGFAGQLAIIADQLGRADCRVDRLAASLAVRITDRQPVLVGPVRAAAVVCAGVTATGAVADVDAKLDARLDRWRGQGRVAVERLRAPQGQLATLAGALDFDGGPQRTAGRVDLRSGPVDVADARATALGLTGRYHVGTAGYGFEGAASAQRAALGPRWLAAIGRARSAGGGTPVGPLLAKASAATAAAARDFGGTVDVRLNGTGKDYALTLANANVTSRSAAQATLSGGDGIAINSSGVRVDGLLALTGGGLPGAVLRLSQAGPRAPIRGSGFVRPYAAGDARLALGDIDFSAAPGATRITTKAVLSGPISDGRIESARAPIEAYWNGRSLRINPGCTAVAFESLRVGSLALDATQLKLCAEGDALARLDGARLTGGARLGATQLTGNLGGSPLLLDAASARYGLADKRFAATGLDARLGSDDKVTRISAATFSGVVAGRGASGDFSGASGQIAKVPLLLSGGTGGWRFDGKALSLDGALQVADADAAPRFYPLESRDVALTLADNQIAATATLTTPANGSTVARVTLAHDLDSAGGHADLDVPGLRFTDTFQPDKLTRFTFGVVAEVKGDMTGTGHIAWNGDKVTSTGSFRTLGTDLAAAFGPVEGLATEIQFTDLLNLVSAPGQQLSLARVNPGVPVEGGMIRYQTLADQHVRIEGGRWPFAGGTLILDPAEVDLAVSAERRLTFRLEGVDAAQFLQELDFKNLSGTGTFDGVLPMIFDAKGGRIERGELNVREGGGTIAYVGEVTQENLGFWGNTAFQALKSLRYKRLAIEMNGALAGDMITEVRFAGVSQGEGAKSNFLIRRLQKLPFVFNVRITAPFRRLFDLSDPGGFAKRVLSESVVAPNTDATPVQPRASESVPKGEPK